MEKKEITVQNTQGRAVAGASVLITKADGSATTIYSSSTGGAAGNPVITDAFGKASFYAMDGRYNAIASVNGVVVGRELDFLLEDPSDNPDVTLTALAADNGSEFVGGTWFDGFLGKVSALGTSIGASLIGFIQAGAGAVARSIQDKLRETVSVKDFGAVGDGVTDDLEAFAKAYDAAEAGGRVKVPAGTFAGVSGALTGTKFVIWETEGQPAGGGIWSLPGLIEQGFTSRKITAIQQTTPDSDNKISFNRLANHSGGAPGFVCTNVTVATTVGASNTNFEWGLLSILNNNAATGENCAFYGQGNKLAVGPTWAGVFEATDKTNAADPVAGLLGLEIDVFANGTDANNNRIGIDFVVGQANRGGSNVACEAYAAVRVNHRNNAGDAGEFKFGMVVNSAKVAGISLRETGRMGIDTSEATFNDATVPNMAFQMASGQRINFSASLTRTLRYEASTTALRYASGSAVLLEVGDDGSLRAGGEIRVLGTKVVGSRDTGWLAMTGTANKNTAYDTTSVTLPQLAGRVMAIQAALVSHGLIGA